MTADTDPHVHSTAGLVMMVIIMTAMMAVMMVRMCRYHDDGATADIIGRRDSGSS